LLHLLKPALKLAAFHSPEGVVLNVVYKNRSIARLPPGLSSAVVARPFDLWLGPGGEMAEFPRRRESLERELAEARRQLDIWRGGIRESRHSTRPVELGAPAVISGK